MSSLDDKLQRGLIITDDISPDPILEFDNYKNAIIRIIKDSYPKFSIGIYGDWGSGKTTLMQSIYDQLEKENEDKQNPIIIVWFNAWRYEREEHFTIIPLLKTIESRISAKQYEPLKKSFKEAVIFGLNVSKDIVSTIVGNYLGKEAGNILKKGITELTGKVIPKLEKLNELEKTTIYFEGQTKIENEIKNIRKRNSHFRIVVFVDDLDRCSPKKVIEVFESIKIFLGLDGFIYILGISQNKISEAIRKKYKFEKEEEGDHYIKKIIQIPISLSEWNFDDVKKLLIHFLEKNIIHQTYQDIINNNLDLISKAAENNPREVKRFLNSFIVACEIFLKGEGIDPINLLVLQAIQVRWNSFHGLIIKHGVNFCEELKKYVDLPNEERIKKLDPENKEDHNFKLYLRNYKSNSELWDFIRDQKNILFNIKDFSPYRRAAESTKDVSVIKSPPIAEGETVFVFSDFLGYINEMLGSISNPETNFIKDKFNEINYNLKKSKELGFLFNHISDLIQDLGRLKVMIEYITSADKQLVNEIERKTLSNILDYITILSKNLHNDMVKKTR